MWFVISSSFIFRDGFFIFVQALGGKRICLEVCPSDKFSLVKKRLEEKLEIPSDFQNLVYQGEYLDDDRTVGDYKIVANSSIAMVSQLKLVAKLVSWYFFIVSFQKWNTDICQSNGRNKI